MTSAHRSIDAGVELGEIFLDKYRVDAILGHGGMGVVAMCTHLALNECVAIKMLRRDVLDDTEAVERFMREAQAASKLRSEYVARVTDVGRSNTNVPYMVMEYLEGHDLGQLLQERGSIALPWAVELTLQACEALAEAHSIGIVHRDVKPTNLFVTWRPDGSALIKVLDFGISKSPITNAMQLTQTQSLLGTPAYMSPEQMRSAHKVDARSDIWSLGTVLYELLEGRRPFEAESFSEMCVKVAVDSPGEMRTTPLPLQQVVLRCLAKAPEQRYASMAELARDLVPFSHDPHQAQVLVERMSRMLRRSQLLDTNQAQPSMSMQIRAISSAERRAELAADAVAAAELPIAIASQISADAPVPSMTYAIPPRRRRGAIVTAAALAAAAAIGVAISLARGPASGASGTTPVERTNATVPARSPKDQPPGPRAATPAFSAAGATATDRGADARDRALREPHDPKQPAAHNQDTDKATAGTSTGVDKPGKPGNDGRAKPPRRDPAAKGQPPAPPACDSDPFAGPHGSNTCSAD
ncbi:MAG TPA: protein kinase [Kofleriaceae bacterium]|nr:protein kinase [Kofleriaceae bacterium]